MGRSMGGTDFWDDFAPETIVDELPEHDVTVSAFYLDEFEVTVGRFRKFVEQFGTPPAEGAGAHPKIPGSGWKSAWNSSLAASPSALIAELKCNDAATWTDAAGPNEDSPINCVTWYAAFAFCAWDGGRLATEAEWEYAAAGGDENRRHPWGGTNPNQGGFANCFYEGTSPFIAVGSFPSGNGRWGHRDLAGSVSEWTLDVHAKDWYSKGGANCVDCANLANTGERVRKGGGFTGATGNLRAAGRPSSEPLDNDRASGVRCAYGDSGGFTAAGGAGGSGGAAGAAGADAGASGGTGTGGAGVGGASGSSGTSGSAGNSGSIPCGSNTCSALEECFQDKLCVPKSVPVTGGYSIDATEVTADQYGAWIATKPATDAQPAFCSWNTSFSPECSSQGKLPQTCLDWCDAYAYCQGIGKRMCGRIGGTSNAYADYKNATRSQWYNACSSGGVHDYPYGDTYDGKKCNIAINDSSVDVGSYPECTSSTPGFTGIFDLSGNVFEWEDSCNAYTGAGNEVCRVRGGSYGTTFMGSDSSCDYTMGLGRNMNDAHLGVRCCSI